MKKWKSCFYVLLSFLLVLGNINLTASAASEPIQPIADQTGEEEGNKEAYESVAGTQSEKKDQEQKSEPEEKEVEKINPTGVDKVKEKTERIKEKEDTKEIKASPKVASPVEIKQTLSPSADDIDTSNWSVISEHQIVRASSELSDSPAAFAVNGIMDDNDNRWRTHSKNESHWLEIHFGHTYNIVGATFETGYTPSAWTVKNMRLEYWDGSEWAVIPGIEVEENNKTSVTLKATEPVETNHVRFHSSDATRGLRVREISVYTDDKVDQPATDPSDTQAATLKHTPSAYSMPITTPYSIVVESDEELVEAEILLMDESKGPSAYLKKFPLQKTGETASGFTYEGALQLSSIGENMYGIKAIDGGGNVTFLPGNNQGYPLTGRKNTGAPEVPTTGLSLEEGQVVSGDVDIYAYSKDASAVQTGQLTLNGENLKTRAALPVQPRFLFQGRSIDIIYNSAVSGMAPDGKTSMLGPIETPEGSWYTFDVDRHLLLDDKQQLSIHTGNESVAYTLDVHDEYFGKTNFDDFYVSKMHLELADYTVVKPESAVLYTGAREVKKQAYNENVEYLLADNSPPENISYHYPMMIDFVFSIPQEKMTASYTRLDTTTLADGTHELRWVDNNQTHAITFHVDNNAPVIEAFTWGDNKVLEESGFIKGKTILDVVVDEPAENIDAVEAWLDGEEITLPYETSSLDLPIGEHTLKVAITDKAGNRTESTRTFQVQDDYPEVTGDVTPADQSEEVPLDARLEVNVSDPNNDDLSVSFYSGETYDFTRKAGITGFRHVADREPPLTMTSPDELPLTADEMDLISKPDGKFLFTDSEQGFPYHRFEVELGEDLPQEAEVEVFWQGSSLPNRIVTLYSWNYKEEKWVSLDAYTAVDADEVFTLKSDVPIEEFEKDGKIQTMIQDQVLTDSDVFHMLWNTDTQFYAKSHPTYFDQLYDWIATSYGKGDFDYMMHTGDIIDHPDNEQQWGIADRNFDKLDAVNVPYGVLAGNHDVVTDKIDYTNYGKYFGEQRFANKPWYGGSMDNNRNHYDLVSFGSQDFIILYIGFGKENEPETEAWANRVLKKHADRNAILGMHAYLESNNTLSAMAQQVYDNIIVPNENIKMVLSGHYHAATRNIKTLTNEDGSERTLVEILYNYQAGPNGGDGYIRLMEFDPSKNTVTTETYSPILDEYNSFGEEDQFTIPFEFNEPTKRVATDYFAVNVYTNEQIGSKQQVRSGETASITLPELLQPEETYYWYVRVSDIDGGEVRSPVYRFTTGEEPPVIENPDDGSGDSTPDPSNPPKDTEDPITERPNHDTDLGSGAIDDKNPSMDGTDNHLANGEGSKGAGDKTLDTNEEMSKDNKLPSTATNMFVYLLVGFLIILVGFIIWFVNDKRRKRV